jgi:iron(III) transport system ATP-binding protein
MYLTLENITKVFPARGGVGEVTAVHNVNLEINKGELVTLLGPSGCGKTTTLRMIAGFEFPTSGNIILDGQPINSLPPHKREMSMVFQSYAIFPHLNVFENISYGLNVQRLTKAKIKERVNKVLDLVHLEGYGDRAPTQLSGGQQQRVALARALVMEPKVLLMDEPLSNLDAKLREEMRTEIRRIQKELNITSVYVTHDQIEAMTLSDRVVIMNQGVIEQLGTPVEVYRFPETAFVANFIGRANFIEGKVVSQKKDELVANTLGKNVHLACSRYEFAKDETINLIVRPEMLRIRKTGEMFDGKIRRAVYLGNSIEYDVEISGNLLTGVENDPNVLQMFSEGESVTVGIIENCVQVLPAKK